MTIEEKIKKWELLEIQYREHLNQLMEEFLKTHESCHRKNFESTIIACNDGMFISRSATKYNTDILIIQQFPGDKNSAMEVFKLNKLEHVRIVNKVRFYSLDYYSYEQCEDFQPISTAENDFQMLASDDNLLDDKYIRTVDDAIELGIFANFERGQFIFRGQVNEDWDLKPRLFRDYPREANVIELALFKNLLMGIRNPYSNTFDPVEQLMNYQHFGIPTRLLDWTSDILIALFFSCFDFKNEYNDKNGKIFLVPRFQFSPFKLNSSENNILRKPINETTRDFFMRRIEIDDIQILEPVNKNPRLRVQDGCFMFFPLLPIDLGDEKYISLTDYLKAKNDFIKKNSSADSSKELWLGYILVDKSFKNSILQELQEKYGIAQNTLSIDTKHVDQVQKYYSNLYEEAKITAELMRNQK